MIPILHRVATCACVVVLWSHSAFSGDAPPAGSRQFFTFGGGAAEADAIHVSADQFYDAARGYGFERGAKVAAYPNGPNGVSSEAPFYFSAALPEGNYAVTVTLGTPSAASTVTIKAELRRLMLEQVALPAGSYKALRFVVNVRRPEFPGGKVHLKNPRESVAEAWAWDDKLTLEFNGTHPNVAALVITPVTVPTVFILGDSTVCDQSKEPYASWGQMLPRFFKPDIAVANHAESGETLRSSAGAFRLDKVLSLAKSGDYVLMQFGHNDMKSKDADAVKTYQATLKSWVEKIKAKGATPVLVTSMNRHSFEGAAVTNSLREYPQAVRDAAAETHTALIDLNAMSKTLYEALGPDGSRELFKHTAKPSEFDGTHHSPYGAYELAKCVIEGIRKAKLDLAAHIAEDVAEFDPAHPDSFTSFKVPPSPGAPGERPLGD